MTFIRDFAIEAPAKLNLYLDVKGRREDGYHEIETLMVPVSLHDTLKFRISEAASPAVSLSRSGLPIDVEPQRDLVHRAAVAWLNAAGVSWRVEIELEKVIPTGAGLGGGSSDAASVLLALNDIGPRSLTGPELAQLAATLGSDVPFFLLQGPAICRGRGELMEPIDLSGAPNEWFLIAVPPVQVSTAMVYRVWSTAWREPNPYRGADDFVARWKAYGDVPYHNGLWRAAAEAAPVLESYRKLLPGFLWTLTGSGSAFYVPLREKGDSDKLLYRIPREAGFSTYLVRR